MTLDAFTTFATFAEASRAASDVGSAFLNSVPEGALSYVITAIDAGEVEPEVGAFAPLFLVCHMGAGRMDQTAKDIAFLGHRAISANGGAVFCHEDLSVHDYTVRCEGFDRKDGVAILWFATEEAAERAARAVRKAEPANTTLGRAPQFDRERNGRREFACTRRP